MNVVERSAVFVTGDFMSKNVETPVFQILTARETAQPSLHLLHHHRLQIYLLLLLSVCDGMLVAYTVHCVHLCCNECT